MGRPNIQKLKHGVTLGKVTTPTFVETWNYITNKLENTKGDGDINGLEGFIKVDNQNPEFPIIRFDYRNLIQKLGDNLEQNPDSDFTYIGLCSLQEKTYEYLPVGAEEGNEQEINLWSLYGFDNFRNQVTVTDSDKDEYDFILRHRSDMSVVKYVKFSEMIDDISNLKWKVDTQVTALNQKSIDKKKITSTNETFIQLHDFDQDNAVELKIDENDDYKLKYNYEIVDVLFRQSKELKYGTVSFKDIKPILGDVNVLTEQKSIETKTNNNKKYHQLYDFDNGEANVNGRYMTLGGLEAARVGKVGKLVNKNGELLEQHDILVRDRNSNTLKYMDLEIDEVLTDSYSANTALLSIMTSSDQQGNEFISLYNFGSKPSENLSVKITDNGTFDWTDGTSDAIWVLTKKMVQGKMTLGYKKLQTTLDVSGLSAYVHCDTDSTASQKSIEMNGTYIQLYGFSNPNTSLKQVQMNNLVGQYDTLDSNDYFVIKSGSQIAYKKVQLNTNFSLLPSGVTGKTANVTIVTGSEYDEEDHKFLNHRSQLVFTNGLLTGINAMDDEEVFTAVEHQAHD